MSRRPRAETKNVWSLWTLTTTVTQEINQCPSGLGVGSDAGAQIDEMGPERENKRTLLNEPAPPPVPIMERKKGMEIQDLSSRVDPDLGAVGSEAHICSFPPVIVHKNFTAFHYFGKNRTKQKNTKVWPKGCHLNCRTQHTL